MDTNPCFVQFPHPGPEQSPSRDDKSAIAWNPASKTHARKFMEFRGKWQDCSDEEQSGEMWAWGEWEPESKVIKAFDRSDYCHRKPHYLWEPFYSQASNTENLHNTDPFIFGEAFLYSNCRQTGKRDLGLRNLNRGSVIVFGSGKQVNGDRKFMLDTVFVVADSIDYNPSELLNKLKIKIYRNPSVFMDVTGNILAQLEDVKLRLYIGATPSNDVNDMFSFFPASPKCMKKEFERPLIKFDDRVNLNPSNWQAPKGAKTHLSCDKVKKLWQKLVQIVRKNDLVLGTYAELPTCTDL